MTQKLILVGLLWVLLPTVVACVQANSATVRLSDFEIKPNRLSAVAGRPFTLTLINEGRVRHNLRLDPAVTDTPLPVALGPGDRVTLTFTPNTAGTFAYWCGFPGHNKAGMVGTLTIEDG